MPHIDTRSDQDRITEPRRPRLTKSQTRERQRTGHLIDLRRLQGWEVKTYGLTQSEIRAGKMYKEKPE